MTSQANYGVFVELAPGVEGLCHSSEIRNNSRKKSKGSLRVGKSYSFKIIGLAEFENRIRLSRRGLPKQAQESQGPDKTPGAAEPKDDATRAKAGHLAAAALPDAPKGSAKRRRRKTAKPRVRNTQLAPPSVVDQPGDVVAGVAAATQAEGSEGPGGDARVALSTDPPADLATSAEAAPEAHQRTETGAARQTEVLETSDGASTVDLPAEGKQDLPRPIEAEPSSEGAAETDLGTADAPPDAPEPAT